jgi:hypothetical protein
VTSATRVRRSSAVIFAILLGYAGLGLALRWLQSAGWPLR